VLVGELSDDWEWSHLAALAALAIPAILISIAAGRAMDAASLGDDEAASVGLPLARLRLILLGLAGLLIAVSVTLAGPIGFVGLVCPHLARLATAMRGGHRTLVVLSALAGAAMVVGSDALIKAIDLGSGRMPLGVVTAMLGGPIFLLMLRRLAHNSR
jgi:ABC-type Fe3+-siderophore transport system permease subunit